MQEEVNKLILTVSDLQCKLNLTCVCLKEEKEKRSVNKTSKHKLAVQLKSATKNVTLSKVRGSTESWCKRKKRYYQNLVKRNASKK